MELHAFNQLHRIHQQQERDAQAPKHRQRKPDALEALSAARTGHGERREVQAKFIDTGRARTLQAGDYAKQADEGFEQFLSPEELAEWKAYTKALDTRAGMAATSAPPPEVPGPIRDADPVSAAIDALTRSKTFSSKLQATLEPARASMRVRLDAASPNTGSPLDSPAASRTPRSGRRSQPGAASVGSTHGIRPSHANIFVVNHSSEHAAVQLQGSPSTSNQQALPAPRGSYSGAGAPTAAGGPAAALRSSLLSSLGADGAPPHRMSGAGNVTGPGATVRFDPLSTSSVVNQSILNSMPDSIDSLTLGDASGVASPLGGSSRARFGRRAITQEMQTIAYGDDDAAGGSSSQPRTSINGAARASFGRPSAQQHTLSTDPLTSGAGSPGGVNPGRAAVNAIEAQAEAARNKFLRLVSARGRDGGLGDGARSKSFTAASGLGRVSNSHVPVVGGGAISNNGSGALSDLASRTVPAGAVAVHPGVRPTGRVSQDFAALPFKPR